MQLQQVNFNNILLKNYTPSTLDGKVHITVNGGLGLNSDEGA